MEKKIVAFVVCAMMFWLGWKFGYEIEHARRPQIIEQTDTITVLDTIVRDSLIPVEVVKWKTVPEYLAVHDTTFLVDSILVDVSMERVVYQKDSVYYAVVTGPATKNHHPSLDTLKVYRETVTIKTTKKVNVYQPYKWTAGPFISQEVGLGNYYVAKAGVAGDFGFKNDRLRFEPEIGYRWTTIEDGGWYAGATLKFDLFRKK